MHELWIFKYQPKSFDDMILDDKTRRDLQKVIDERPNVMLSSKHGMGKGTFSSFFIDRAHSLWLNGSDERSIDTMRSKVKGFARAMSTTDLKYVVINEADQLLKDAQLMLREEIEVVQKVTRFIFMVNFPYMIMEELASRFWMIEFNNPPSKAIFDHCVKILMSEGIPVNQHNKKGIISLINQDYPDMRKIITNLQMSVHDGVIDLNKSSSSSTTYDLILKNVLAGDLNEVRRIVRSEYIDYPGLYSFLYDRVDEFKLPGEAIILIGEHLYRDGTHSIKEINFFHMIIQMMKIGVV